MHTSINFILRRLQVSLFGIQSSFNTCDSFDQPALFMRNASYIQNQSSASISDQKCLAGDYLKKFRRQICHSKVKAVQSPVKNILDGICFSYLFPGDVFPLWEDMEIFVHLALSLAAMQFQSHVTLMVHLLPAKLHQLYSKAV